MVFRASFFAKFPHSNFNYMKKLLLSLFAVCTATVAMAQGQSVIYSTDFNSGIPTDGRSRRKPLTVVSFLVRLLP